MEQLNEFMVNNYIWITIVCLFLIFTLIGYIADKSKNRNSEIKEQKKIKPAPIVKNEEVKEIVNNGEDITNKEDDVKPESITDIEVPTKIEENVSNEVTEPQFEEPVIATKIEQPEDPKQKSLEELMAENDISETSAISSEDNNGEMPNIDVEQQVEQNNEESVNDEIPKDAEVVNTWEPELTVENKDIVPENDDEKKDSI